MKKKILILVAVALLGLAVCVECFYLLPQSNAGGGPPPTSSRLTRSGNKLKGPYLANVQSDGSGVLVGFGKYTALTDTGVPVSKIRELFCLMRDTGFNYFRMFTTLRLEASRKNYFLSVWDNKTGWQTRLRDILQQAAACQVYVQLALFDKPSQNDGDGYERYTNSWNGKTPSLDLAKTLSRDYYLAGLQSSVSPGTMLIVEHANEPASDWWAGSWDGSFNSWLKSSSLGAWAVTAVNLASLPNDQSDYLKTSVADKLDIHIKTAEMGTAVDTAKTIRTNTGRPVGISTDGAGFIPPSSMGPFMKNAMQNGISTEFLMSGLNPFLLDAPVSVNGWSGTAREYIRQVSEYIRPQALGGAPDENARGGGWFLGGDSLRDGNIISLYTYHGRFVVGEDSGAVKADRTSVGAWEHFSVRPMTATNGGKLIPMGQSAPTVFRLVTDGRGERPLVVDYNSGRLSLGQSGDTSAKTQFYYHLLGNQIALEAKERRGSGQPALCAAEGSLVEVNANRSSIGNWEKFYVTVY